MSAKRNFSFAETDTSLDQYRQRGRPFKAELLRDLVDFSNPTSFWRYVRLIESIPIFDKQLYVDSSRNELRELYIRQIAAIHSKARLTIPEDDADPTQTYALVKAMIAFDIGLETRYTVHTCLYFDTVRELGSEKHMHLCRRALEFKDYGCFALTELGHGSNANGILTTATYDHPTRSFILSTPTQLAAKFWIGAAGKTANMLAVLAHLIVNDTDYGLHAFVIPIRHYETHDPLPGVVLGDCGPKAGLDGIDNGFIIFNDYRVPYDALLDRFSQISPSGHFKSSIKNKTKRFATMLSGLFRGRSGVFMTSASQLRNALTIAIRYSAVRKQFALSDGPEVPILNYQMHRYRLMPHLANYFAVALGTEQFIVELKRCREQFREDPEHSSKEEVHAVASVMKVLSSMYGMTGLQECREACGGLGYSAFSMLGIMRESLDVTTTWEGANHVLIQQPAKFILKGVQKLVKGQRIETRSLAELTLDQEAVATAKLPDGPLGGQPQLLVALLSHKLNRLVHNSMLKLQENVASCKDVTHAWNQTQVHHLYDAAVAYGELHYAKLMLAKCAELKAVCADTAALFLKITELFVYTKVEKDLAVFRENDYVSTAQGHAIKAYIVTLCEELAESSVRIIDAIALPDKLIGSPLGAQDGQVYRHFMQAVEGAKGCYEKASWVGMLHELRRSKL
jgi:acyl-CoA oxidase